MGYILAVILVGKIPDTPLRLATSSCSVRPYAILTCHPVIRTPVGLSHCRPVSTGRAHPFISYDRTAGMTKYRLTQAKPAGMTKYRRRTGILTVCLLVIVTTPKRCAFA